MSGKQAWSEVLGLNGTPEAGDILNVVSSETEAREIADKNLSKIKKILGFI